MFSMNTMSNKPGSWSQPCFGLKKYSKLILIFHVVYDRNRDTQKLELQISIDWVTAEKIFFGGGSNTKCTHPHFNTKSETLYERMFLPQSVENAQFSGLIVSLRRMSGVATNIILLYYLVILLAFRNRFPEMIA